MPKTGEIKKRIIDYAKEQYFRFGFTRVTMDEISSGLGISKKTLYQQYSSKEKLLWAVIEFHMKETGDNIDAILLKTDVDFLEKLKELMLFLGTQLSKVGRPFIQDIRKHAPDLWKEIDDFRHKRIISRFGQLFDEGVKKGVFRNDINPQLLMTIYSNTIQNTINPETLTQLPFMVSEVFESIMKIIFEGALTEKARAKYSVIRRQVQRIK